MHRPCTHLPCPEHWAGLRKFTHSFRCVGRVNQIQNDAIVRGRNMREMFRVERVGAPCVCDNMRAVWTGEAGRARTCVSLLITPAVAQAVAWTQRLNCTSQQRIKELAPKVANVSVAQWNTIDLTDRFRMSRRKTHGYTHTARKSGYIYHGRGNSQGTNQHLH